MSENPNIILTGFMGTGKTTVGRRVAARLGYEFVDTDSIIESRHGPIPEIFADQGEEAFRRYEREVAAELSQRQGLVISTGGRMMLDPGSAELLGRDARVFCLTATPEEILQRVLGDQGAAERPLLSGPDPAGRIAELLAERAPLYAQFPQVSTSGRSSGQVAGGIVDVVRGAGMRTIGLLGGMSWESSIEYYRIINEEVRARLGGTHSARSMMYSVDFYQVEELQASGDWAAATELMVDAARKIQAGGGECLVICTNTMHRMADEVQAAIDIPVLHIADATAAAVKATGIGTVALLGTRYTMEQGFYRGRLESMHGLRVLVPDEPDRTMIHDVIYEELVQGVANDASRTRYLGAIDTLVAAGAEGVIAGCTEIELLVGPDDVTVPYFPTTRLHALAAVDWALGTG